MKHKVCAASQLKILSATDGGSEFGTIQGYAATFGNKDRVGDIIQPGAFAAHLSAFLHDGFVAVGHDWGSLPVATPTEAREDAHGLWVSADFHSTPDAQAARTVAQERIARGKSVAFSIGYEEGEAEQTKDGRLLKDLPLYEFSLVNVPANPQALSTGVKQLGGDPDWDAMCDEWDALDLIQVALTFIRNRRALQGADADTLAYARGILDEVSAVVDELQAAAPPEADAAPPPNIGTMALPRRTSLEAGDTFARAAAMTVSVVKALDRLAARRAANRTKAGRTISADNHAQLTTYHAALGAVHEQMGTFLTTHAPKDPPTGEQDDAAPTKGDPAVGRRLYAEFLQSQTRAARLRGEYIHG